MLPWKNRKPWTLHPRQQTEMTQSQPDRQTCTAATSTRCSRVSIALSSLVCAPTAAAGDVASSPAPRPPGVNNALLSRRLRIQNRTYMSYLRHSFAAQAHGASWRCALLALGRTPNGLTNGLRFLAVLLRRANLDADKHPVKALRPPDHAGSLLPIPIS